MTGRSTSTLLRSAGGAGRILVGFGIVYAALAARLVIETVAALGGEDFLGVLGVVLGGGLIVLVLIVYVLLALAHVRLGRRFLSGNPDGYPPALAMLVLDGLHFGVYGWWRIGRARDVTWINAWTDHDASVRRQGFVYVAVAAVALIGLIGLIRWVRTAPGKPLPTVSTERSASTQAVMVALMLLSLVVANEVLQNRRVALRVRDASAAVDEQVRWSFPVPSDAPVVARGGGRMFLAGDDGELSAIDEMTGALMWAASISRGTLGVAYGGGAVVVSDLETVVALNAATGERMWEVGPAGRSTCVVEPPVADDSAVYVVATQRDGSVTQLQSLEAGSGRERWRLSWEDAANCGSKRSMAVGEGLIVVADAGAGDGLTAIDTSDGQVRWRTELEGSPEGPPAIVGGSVFATTAGRFVYGLDHDTGSVRWRRDLGFGARGPVTADEELVILEDRGVLALDPADGGIKWRTTTGEDVLTPVGIDARYVYASTGLGTFIRLHTLDRKNGREYSCIALSEWSDAALTIGSRDGPTVVSRSRAFAIRPQRLSSTSIATLRVFGSDDHTGCPVAEVS